MVSGVDVAHSTLQHTATHCITLQHTATHCNILPNNAINRRTLQHTATHCNTLQYTATHCNNAATHCNTLQQRCNNTATQCNTCVPWKWIECVASAAKDLKRVTLQQHCNNTATTLQHTPTTLYQHYNTCVPCKLIKCVANAAKDLKRVEFKTSGAALVISTHAQCCAGTPTHKHTSPFFQSLWQVRIKQRCTFAYAKI